jgi:uncharacterized repeat protein (TIGR04076 family)
MPRSKVKITVLKRVDPSVIFDGDVPTVPGTDRKFTVCTAFEDGQEFIVETGKPEGFCDWAWRDVFKDVSVLVFGGNFPLGRGGDDDHLLHRRHQARLLQDGEDRVIRESPSVKTPFFPILNRMFEGYGTLFSLRIYKMPTVDCLQ